MGSGRREHADLAEPLGRLLAGMGVHLLTGGGAGVMEAVSRAFAQVADRAGLVIGVLPAGREGYPNRWVEVPIATHLPLSGERGMDPLSRNHINVLSSAAIVTLPGGPGTLSETLLAMRYGRPVAAYLHAGGGLDGLPPDVQVFHRIAGVGDWLRHQLGG